MSQLKEEQLFRAVFYGDLVMVESLSGDPNLNINWRSGRGSTPFFMACQNGHKEVVSLLLANPRIDPKMPNNNGVDTKRRVVTEDPVENGKTAAEWARMLGLIKKPKYMENEVHTRVTKIGPIIADLIDAYEKDPAKVRSQLRKELGLRGISFPSSLPHYTVRQLKLLPNR